MIKYAKVENRDTGLCSVALGSNEKFYREIGMEPLDVEMSDIDNLWYIAEKCPHKPQEQIEQEEQDRVNCLTMTPLDFITFLENINIPYSSIQTYLNNNPQLDKQLKYCQNVYCGVVKQLLPITVDGITITSEIVEHAFKVKNGEL